MPLLSSFFPPNPVLVPCWISLIEAQLTPPKHFSNGLVCLFVFSITPKVLGRFAVKQHKTQWKLNKNKIEVGKIQKKHNRNIFGGDINVTEQLLK